MAIDDQAFEQKFEDLLKSLNKLVYNLDPNNRAKLQKGNAALWPGMDPSKKYTGLAGAAQKVGEAHGTLKYASDAVTKSFMGVAQSSDGLLHAFKELAEVFVLGKAFTALFDAGEKLGESYSKLTSIGQTFGGSMINMAMQASQAGVPLGVFTELLQRQATASAVMATNTDAGSITMGMFAKNVRNNLKQFGFYGMSVADLNDLTADYAETLRKQNLLTGANTKVNTQSVLQFAKDLSDFSAVTGVSRDKIAELTNSALNDTSLQDSNLTPQQMQKVTQATAGLASLPGQIGPALSTALAQTIGRGGVQFSDLGKELYSAGFGQIAGTLQNYADDVASGKSTKGDLASFVEQLQNTNSENSQYIINQIKADPNGAVAQIGGLLNDLNGINAADLAKENAQEDALTKFFNTLQSTLQTLETSFSGGFYSVMKSLNLGGANFFNNLGNEITNIFGPIFTALGSISAQAIMAFFGLFNSGGPLSGTIQALQRFASNPDAINKTITDIVTGFQELGHVLKDVWSVLMVFGKVFSYVIDIVKGIYKVMSGGGYSKTTGVIGTGAVLFAGYKLLKGVFKGFFGKLNITAGIVYLNSKLGLGGGLGKLGSSLGGLGRSAKSYFGLGKNFAVDAAKGGGNLLEKFGKYFGEKAGTSLKNIFGLGKTVAKGAVDLATNPEAKIIEKSALRGTINPLDAIPGLDLGPAEILGAGAGLAYGAYKIYKDRQSVQPANIKQNLTDEYNDTLSKITADKKEDEKAVGLHHLNLLKEIAMLQKKQLDLQHQIGVQNLAQEKRQTSATQAAAQNIKRLGG